MAYSYPMEMQPVVAVAPVDAEDVDVSVEDDSADALERTKRQWG